MAVFKQSQIFPYIANAINELWEQRQSWVRRDDIIEYLMQKPEVVAALIQSTDLIDTRQKRWYIGNAIDWFSQQLTAGTSSYIGQYDRERIAGKWAYVPAGQRSRASANLPSLQAATGTQPRYSLGDYLGKGGNAYVYKGVRRMRGEPDLTVAFKVYKDEFDEDERDLLLLIDHPNVIKLIDTCDLNIGGRPERALVLEYADGGAIHNKIDASVNGFSHQELLPLLLTIADGIAYLHHFSPKQIIHRDIKPANILLVNGIPKVSDVGIAKQVTTTTVLHTAGLTPAYAAPEMFGSMSAPPTVSHKADIYSLGISVFQMLTKRLPFRAASFYELSSLHQNEPVPSDPRISSWSKEFVERCTVKDYRLRWSIDDALEFLHSI